MANILKSDFLYETLRERILSGVYSCGNSLPREVDLSQEFGVARNTLRRALGELESVSIYCPIFADCRGGDRNWIGDCLS